MLDGRMGIRGSAEKGYKFGGIAVVEIRWVEFFDIDNNKSCTISRDATVWLGRRRGNNGGWGLFGFNEDWRQDDPNKEDNEEKWLLFDGCPIHDLLLEFYDKSKEMDVVAIARGEEEDDKDSGDDKDVETDED